MSVNLGTASGKIELDASGAVSAYKKTSQEHKTFMGGLQGSRHEMRRAGTALTAVGGAALAGFGLAVKTAAGFEKSMNRVGAVSGATGDDFDKLRQQAKDLGASTAFSASEAADGMSYLAMAGFETDEILSAMPGTLALAAAGQIDLARAADIASNVLTGYGFEAEDIGRVNDVMAKTAASANTDIDQLGDAMSYVAPVAKASGLEFEETAAIIGKLSDAGIQGSRAGTTLRQAIASLENQTPKAAKKLEELGVSTHDASGALRPMTDIVADLADAGLSTGDAMEIFGTRAGPGVMALVGQGSEAIRELQGDLEGAQGAAQEMADRQLEGLSGALVEMKSAVEGALIAVGEQLTPVLERLVDAIRPIIQGFAQMNPNVVRFNAIGGALAALITVLAGGFLLMLSFLGMAAAGWATFTASVLPVVAPILAVIAVIAAVTAAVIYLWNTNETFRNVVIKIWEGIKATAMAVFGALQQFWADHGEQILATARNVWETVQNVIKTVISVIQNIITTFISVAQGFWNRFGETILHMAKTAWNFIRRTIENVINVIRGIIQVVTSAIRGDWSGVWNGIKTIASAVWDQIVNIINAALQFLIGIIHGMVNAAIGLWNSLKDKIIEAAKAAWEGAKEMFSSLVDFVKELPGRMLEFFKNLPSEMLQIGKDMIKGLIDGIKNMAGAATNAAREVGSNAVNAVKGLFKIGSPSKVMMELGEDVGQGLAIGIEQMQRAARKAAGTLASAVTTGLPSPDVAAAYAGSRHAPSGRGISSSAGSNVTKTWRPVIHNEVHNPTTADLERASERALRRAAASWGVQR